MSPFARILRSAARSFFESDNPENRLTFDMPKVDQDLILRASRGSIKNMRAGH
jgi:hypothetical protein